MTSEPSSTAAEPLPDLAALPAVMLVPDMARALRRAVGTVRRDLQRGTFRPLPFATRPYRWLRSSFLAYLAELEAQNAMPRPRPDALQPTRRRVRR